MTDSLDEILSANQKLYVLNQKLTEEVKRLREALEFYAGQPGCVECGQKGDQGVRAIQALKKK